MRTTGPSRAPASRPCGNERARRPTRRSPGTTRPRSACRTTGSLIDGTQLPIDGPDWVTWDPVTDSVPNEPDRLYGNERTIRTIIAVTDAYRAANPEAPRVVVGDISRKGGGPMTDEHVSHQNGLDVDIYYPRARRELRAPTSPDQIDRRLAQDLVDRFVAAGAQMVFVGFSTGLHGPSGVVIPYPNHENHMHVRFPPPGGCQPSAATISFRSTRISISRAKRSSPSSASHARWASATAPRITGTRDRPGRSAR